MYVTFLYIKLKFTDLGFIPLQDWNTFVNSVSGDTTLNTISSLQLVYNYAFKACNHMYFLC